MGEVSDAVSAWEQRIEGLEAAVKAVRAGLKMLEAARSGDATMRAWESVEATRAALVAYAEDEADKFKTVAAFQRQTALDLDGSQSRRRDGEGGEQDDGKPKPHPQEPLALGPATVPTDREGNILSGDPNPGPDGDEDPDKMLDADDDDDDESDEDGDETDRGDLDGPNGDGEIDEDARTEDEDEE